MTDAVRRTKIGTSEIITTKSEDPFLLRPYQTFVLSDGVCGRVCPFGSEALALNYHDNLVAVMTKKQGL